ncbi:phosphotransferase [Phytomonospora endophytica]|uniref:Homoserine kinase type II n=1 Tax=Phytomonospora endophytica TaxID=714109 RepID=A0A841FQ38_9ACTN|nr:phosphotransferase [Phytomonospora endophytica]MBB6038206.1 homoserine kinase type II [Phytomonospora endophytica]
MGRLNDDPSNAGDALAALVAVYGLESVTKVSFIIEGLMNRNWRLETTRGGFVLKQLLDVSPTKARRNFMVLAALAEFGLPVPVPMPASNGDLVVELEDGAYCLFEWASGAHVRGTDLTPAESAKFGELVGSLHDALNSDRISDALGGPPERPRADVTAPESAVAEAERFLAVVEALKDPHDFDATVAVDLRQRLKLINAYEAHRPEGVVSIGPVGWTHGDLQYRNLLWSDSKVSAVLDWDRIGARPLADEVVRTAQVQFGLPDGQLNLERIATFASAYQSRFPLSAEALVDAGDRLWWKRMTDFWPLIWHYDKGDSGPDDIWLAGERQLAWWCEHRAEVTAAFLGNA